MSKIMRLGMVVFAVGLSLGGAGCSATAAPAETASVVVQRGAVAVVVEGEGQVEGGTIACGSGTNGACNAEFEELALERLVARPARGWTFTGWRRSIKNSRLSPSSLGPEIVEYTATFTRSTMIAASADRR